MGEFLTRSELADRGYDLAAKVSTRPDVIANREFVGWKVMNDNEMNQIYHEYESKYGQPWTNPYLEVDWSIPFPNLTTKCFLYPPLAVKNYLPAISSDCPLTYHVLEPWDFKPKLAKALPPPYKEDEELEDEQFTDLEFLNDAVIVKCEDDRFLATIDCAVIPKSRYGLVIGKGGKNKNYIERRFQVKVSVKPEEDACEILGSNQKKVMNAVREVFKIAVVNRKMEKASHFVAVKLAGKLSEEYEKFKGIIETKLNQKRQIVKPTSESKLHLTLCALAIISEEELEYAKNILNEAVQSLSYSQIPLEIKGLEIMNDDPSQVDILYAKVHTQDNALHKLTSQLMKSFSQSYMLIDKFKREEGVKLHLTVLRKCDKAFDATEILKEYADYEFGELELDSICLCETQSTDLKSGFYKVVSEVCFTQIPMAESEPEEVEVIYDSNVNNEDHIQVFGDTADYQDEPEEIYFSDNEFH